jgi:hypothetical protein
MSREMSRSLGLANACGARELELISAETTMRQRAIIAGETEFGLPLDCLRCLDRARTGQCVRSP